jgi:hypothetical protein
VLLRTDGATVEVEQRVGGTHGIEVLFGARQRVGAGMSLAVLLAGWTSAQTTTRESVDSTGAQGNDTSSACAISGDGRYIAFHSDASNLVVGDTNGSSDVFVRDRQSATTVRVSVNSSGAQGNNAAYYGKCGESGSHPSKCASTSTLPSPPYAYIN